MIKNYYWSPDTCKCRINETHDTETNEWNAVESYVNPSGETILSIRCEAHQDISDIEELYGVLHKNPDGENKVKNQVYRLLIGLEGIDLGLSTMKQNRDGSEFVALKDNVQYEWSFTGTGKDRVLEFTVNGENLSTNQKNSIKDKCLEKFGSKVKLI